jgi:hypothetical protein
VTGSATLRRTPPSCPSAWSAPVHMSAGMVDMGWVGLPIPRMFRIFELPSVSLECLLWLGVGDACDLVGEFGGVASVLWWLLLLDFEDDLEDGVFAEPVSVAVAPSAGEGEVVDVVVGSVAVEVVDVDGVFPLWVLVCSPWDFPAAPVAMVVGLEWVWLIWVEVVPEFLSVDLDVAVGHCESVGGCRLAFVSVAHVWSLGFRRGVLFVCRGWPVESASL